MPKVSKCEFIIKNKKECFDIWYSRRTLFHLKTFDFEVIKATNGLVPKQFETEKQLIAYYEELINRYNTLISRTKKVIFFKIKPNDDVLWNERDENGSREGFQEWTEKLIGIRSINSHHSQAGFLLDYEVCYEVSGNQTKYYHINDKNDTEEMSWEFQQWRDFQKIDWTEERELFFKNVVTKSNEMVKNILLFLYSPKAELEQKIDNGVKLLNN